MSYEKKTKAFNQNIGFLHQDQQRFLQTPSSCKRKGIAWSSETLKTSFQIRYICGVRGYEFLRSLAYPLPSYRTLCNRVQHSSFAPGIQYDVIKWLDIKASTLCDQEKDCVLMLDEMALRKCLQYDKGLGCIVGEVSAEVQMSSCK